MAALWPVYGPEEEAALTRVLRSRVWCRVKEAWDEGETGVFERAFRQRARSRHFMAVANGTVAIELALQALRVRPGDEVLVPGATFHGSVTPILRQGAVPVFVDSHPDSWLLDPDSVAERISPRTRGVVVPHLYGLPADMDRLTAICRQHGLFMVEDCAQATASEWRNRQVGTFGEVGCFSFQQDKNLNSGEGGGVATQDDRLAGILYALQTGYWVEGAPLMERVEVSTNGRISPWQAAVLNCQLERLDEQHERRERSRLRLMSLLDDESPLEPVHIPAQVTKWSMYSFPFRFRPERVDHLLTRDQFMRILRAEGVPASEGHTDPVYRRPLFQDNDLTHRNDGCPRAEFIADHEAVVIGQKFFLGPPAWADRLAEVLAAIREAAPRLAGAVAV